MATVTGGSSPVGRTGHVRHALQRLPRLGKFLGPATALALAAACTSTHTLDHSAPARIAVAAQPSATIPRYTAMITITAMKGSPPTCHATSPIPLGTWYAVRQYGNAPVSFRIPGVPEADRWIPRRGTYTDSDFAATKPGTYKVLVSPSPAQNCQFTVTP